MGRPSTLAKQKTYFPYAPSREVVTPHFDWYHPAYGGPLRLLYLGNYGASREVVELAQVLDVDYTAPCIHPGDWDAIIGKAVDQAKRGDAMARKFIADYLIGAPVQKNENENSGEITLRVIYDEKPGSTPTE